MTELEVERSRSRFEERLNSLRGRRVMVVDYWDVHNYSAEPPEWDYGDWHHAVMGVQLATDKGPVAVTWTSTFYPYGVEVFHQPIDRHLVTGEYGPERVGPVIDEAGPWVSRLESPICGTASQWERLDIGPGRRWDGSIARPAYSVDLPVALRLDFAAGPVWFVAGMPHSRDMRDVFIPGDEIMVVFSGEKMRDIGFHDSLILRAPE